METEGSKTLAGVKCIMLYGTKWLAKQFFRHKILIDVSSKTSIHIQKLTEILDRNAIRSLVKVRRKETNDFVS